MKLWSSKQEKNENCANSAMDTSEPKLLSFFDLLSIGVGGSWGIGASVLIGEIIKNKAGPAVVVSIFLAGVTALIGGLCFSEFGVRFLKVNSAYAYSYFCNRETAAFILGWALLLQYVAGTASAAKGVVIFTDALTDYKISDVLKNVAFINLPNVFPHFDFFSLGIIIIITILIAIGLKDSMNIKKIFIVCNMVLVSSIIIAGAFKADVKNWQTKQTSDENPKNGFAPFGVLGVVNGAALAFCGFIGFDAVSVSGAEVIKQKRNLPVAILVTILITLVAFIGVGVILTLMLPYDKLNSHAAVVSAFQEMGWTSLKWITAVGTFFGFQTSLFGAIFPLPRIMYDMANDGLLFSFLGNCDSTSKIPVAASITGGLLAAVAAGFFSFQKLVSLTIIGALFVCTVLSINVLLLRYSPKFDDEILSESWKNLVNTNREVTVKAIVQNYFNFKEKYPTNLTGTIIFGNILLFCISSIGLSIILNVYYDRIVQCSTEIVISGGVLLCIMIFSFLSLTCQPKSQKDVPFKVPLTPFVPCLGIFLNTFLMLTFESLTWILFAIWMAAGVLPHFVWILLKCLKGERRENSLYEINKSNALKLNESIWKINLEKKSFYEGAINPVFSDELEEKYIESRTDRFCEVEQDYKETSLQLKQAEIIPTSELVVEEKAEPLGCELELGFIRADSAENINVLTEKENIQWECVAEIHSKEEFQSEIVALEIVDNTYNFLTEVSEELSKDDVSLKEAPRNIVEEESLNPTDNAFNGNSNSEKDFNLPLQKLHSSLENVSESTNSKTYSEKANLKLFKEELLNKINSETSDKNNISSKKSGDVEKFDPKISEESRKENESLLVGDFTESQASVNSSQNHNEEQIMNLIIKTFYEAHKGKMILNSDSTVATETAGCSPVLDEQNKIKEFKEKLNQLLKSQINNGANKTINSSLTKSSEPNDIDQNNEENKNGSVNNIKTLNKSQIKGKLELLLAKGPPKRMSLSSSFNIKIKEANKENKIEKEEDEIQKGQNNTNVNIRDPEPILIRTLPILADSIKEKILTLKKVDTVDC